MSDKLKIMDNLLSNAAVEVIAYYKMADDIENWDGFYNYYIILNDHLWKSG